MQTQIEYLEQLAGDLHEAAVRESLQRLRSMTAGGDGRGRAPSPRRSRGSVPRYAKLVAAAAAFLIIAGGVGYFAGGNGGGVRSFLSPRSEATSGSGAGGGAAPSGDAGGSRAPAPSNQVLPGPEPQAADEQGVNQVGEARGIGEISKIIKTARLGIVIEHDSFDAKFQDASEIASNAGGFVSSSSQGIRSGSMVLRVPARRFDGVREKLKALGIKVENESIDGQDVTAQYIDLRARLEILNERKDSLLKLLGPAAGLDSILRLTSVIDEVQFRIEEIKGRLRLIKDQTSQATISISMREEGVEPQENVENPSLASAWDKSIAGFLGVIGAVVVGLGYLIPIAVVGGLVWLLVRLRRTGHPAGSRED